MNAEITDNIFEMFLCVKKVILGLRLSCVGNWYRMRSSEPYTFVCQP